MHGQHLLDDAFALREIQCRLARGVVARTRSHLRPFLYRERALPGAVLAVLLRAIRATLCRMTPEAPPDAQLGAISFPHRFGSSLNPGYAIVVAMAAA